MCIPTILYLSFSSKHRLNHYALSCTRHKKKFFVTYVLVTCQLPIYLFIFFYNCPRCERTLKNIVFSRVLIILLYNFLLSLGELWCTTCLLQTIFLSFLHAGIAGKESCALEDRSEISVCLIQCAGNPMTDRTRLTSKSTTADCHLHIIFICCIRCLQWLTDDDLQRLKTKVFVHIFFIDRYFTGARCKIYTGNA